MNAAIIWKRYLSPKRLKTELEINLEKILIFQSRPWQRRLSSPTAYVELVC